LIKVKDMIAVSVLPRADCCAGMDRQHLEASMNKRLARVGVGLVIACLSGATMPQARPTATILAGESDNCEVWMVNHTPAHRSWVFGYLSGLNAAWGGDYRSSTDLLAKIEGEQQVLLWMDNHCRRNPTDSLQKSAHQLYRELATR
jgi:hypothetical protein